MAARQHNVIILVRHTNDNSLKYVGKAKTANINPPPVTRLVNGLWGVERQATNAPRWSWRVDVDPASQHFGCLQLKTGDADASRAFHFGPQGMFRPGSRPQDSWGS